MKVYDLNNNEIDETTEKYYYLHDLFTALGENPWPLINTKLSMEEVVKNLTKHLHIELKKRGLNHEGE